MVSSILGCLLVTVGLTDSPTPGVGLRMLGLLLTGPKLPDGAVVVVGDGGGGGGGGGVDVAGAGGGGGDDMGTGGVGVGVV